MGSAERLYLLLKELFLILDEGDQYLFALYNLSVTRYYTLFHLNSNPGASLSDLSRLMLCDKSNVTRIAKLLERDGLVYREGHETDRRSSRLFLTPVGAETESKVRLAHAHFNELRFQTSLALTNQTDSLVPLLEQLKTSLKRELANLRTTATPTLHEELEVV